MTELLLGDCLERLKELPDCSVDSLVTDPPAGISFMGKDWDSDKGGRAGWVAWMTEVMRECHRVLKPGAHGLVWAIPRTSHWTATALEDAGFEVRDVITHLFGQGFPKSLNIEKAGAGPEWSGWGTALKPASEHWILVRKPVSEKNVAANVLKWGTGGINVDGCRIESGADYHELKVTQGGSDCGVPLAPRAPEPRQFTPASGRFPANLVLSHSPHCTEDQCDIECAILALDTQSGLSAPKKRRVGKRGGKGFGMFDDTKSAQANGVWPADQGGGASRFFYCAKISPGERGEGNNHPTVKPQKLMRYLCRLVTPTGGVVLDTFMGSGSTGMAAKSEGFKFIGVERDAEYYKIAKARIANAPRD